VLQEELAMFTLAKKLAMPAPGEALPGRPTPIPTASHQQYLAKNPFGYCGLGGTGVSCRIGTGVAAH
jgi:peptide-methionine (S)-S-oxide reductase